MTRKIRSKKNLLKSSRHIAYEIQMLHQAYVTYSTPRINKNVLLRSAFIEVFLLHCRILYDFFYRRKGKNPIDDDVIVEDFLSNKEFINFKKHRSLKGEIDKYFPLKRANKELAHLSYYRLAKTPKTKQWQISKIYKNMSKTISSFLKNTDSDTRKEMLKLKYLNLFN
ncbi:MAG: hypothetical protein WC349_04220 [Patescibacteria group bacterium]|jgi:hypothetical protein